MALVKRGKTFYVRFKLGGRRYFRSTGFSDQRRARAKANEIEAEIREGGGTRTCPTLKRWLELYSKTYSAAKGAGGKALDLYILPPAVEKLGPSRRLSSITPSEILAWRDGVAKTHTQNTVRLFQGVLGAFFQAACRDGRLRLNPVRGIRRPRPIPRSRVLSLSEQSELLTALSPRHRLPIEILLATGLRVSELLSLTPQSVGTSGISVLGKGKKQRLVPLTPSTRLLVDSWVSDLGRVRSRRMLLEALHRACRKRKIPPLTLHDLRRTFGTRCAEKIPMPRLAKMMGHSAITTTAQYYVHLDEIDGSALLERVNLLGNDSPSKVSEKR
jgi:integrase